jgi:hypothetical protein
MIEGLGLTSPHVQYRAQDQSCGLVGATSAQPRSTLLKVSVGMWRASGNYRRKRE